MKDQLARRHVRVGTLEQLTAPMIETFITRRIRLDDISPKTANRQREVLHVMFNHAIRHHGFRSLDRRFPNPVDAVTRRREAEQPIRHLSLEEIGEQLDARRSMSVSPICQHSPTGVSEFDFVIACTRIWISAARRALRIVSVQ